MENVFDEILEELNLILKNMSYDERVAYLLSNNIPLEVANEVAGYYEDDCEQTPQL